MTLHCAPSPLVAEACAGLSKAALIDVINLMMEGSFRPTESLARLVRQARQNQHWREYEAANAEYDALLEACRAMTADAVPLVGPRAAQYVALRARIEMAYQRANRAHAAGDKLWAPLRPDPRTPNPAEAGDD